MRKNFHKHTIFGIFPAEFEFPIKSHDQNRKFGLCGKFYISTIFGVFPAEFEFQIFYQIMLPHQILAKNLDYENNFT